MRLSSTLVVLALMLVLGACDGLGPSDEPLPTVAQLRAEFERQPEGRGLVRESNGGFREPYETNASYYTTGTGELSELWVELSSDNPASAISISMALQNGQLPRLGDTLTAGVFYGGTVGGTGTGVLGITSVDNNRIEGVFVSDIVPYGFDPTQPRIRGAFNAVLVPEPSAR